MTIVDFIIISLAAWYVAYSTTKLSGPFDIFGRVRDWAQRGIKAGDRIPNGSFAELTACIYCAAFWAAALLYAVWVLTPFQPAVYILALAGGALAVDRWISSV